MKELWTEKYRPSTLTDYVFRDDAQRKQVQGWVDSKTIPHLLFSGAPGTGNQGHYDILIKDRDNNDISSLEVKTTFGKTKWSSGSNKTGYGLFFAYNKERERFFAVSTFVGETEWTDMGKGAFEMRVETLYNKDDNEVKYYLGDIEVDNDVYRIQKYKVSKS